MSNFTQPLTVTKIDTRRWKLERAFTYYINEEGGESITVPKLFITDFASVPRIFWTLFPPDGRYTQSAVLHDYLYFKQIYSRRRSDRIFLESMKVLKVSWWRRRSMWVAVRSFGFIPWNRHAKRLKKSKDSEAIHIV